MYNKVQDLINALKRLQAALDQLISVAELVAEAPTGTDRAEETKPNTVYDFSCHCPELVRQDRLPWYTSGFQ